MLTASFGSTKQEFSGKKKKKKTVVLLLKPCDKGMTEPVMTTVFPRLANINESADAVYDMVSAQNKKINCEFSKVRLFRLTSAVQNHKCIPIVIWQERWLKTGARAKQTTCAQAS